MKKEFAESVPQVTRMFSPHALCVKPLLSVDMEKEIEHLTQKFKLLNFGLEQKQGHASRNEFEQENLIEERKDQPNDKLKRVPQMRKLRIPRWFTKKVAEYIIDNDYIVLAESNIDLPFYPFSRCAFLKDKQLLVTGGLNDEVPKR